MPEIIEHIGSLQGLKTILEENPGMVFIKFSADWCKPCQKIKSHVDQWFIRMPDTVQVVTVDIDEDFEVYAFLKNKRMLNGIPAILMYRKGNVDIAYDEIVSSSNIQHVDEFFAKCLGLPIPGQAPVFPLFPVNR
jgi:thiol:disulfide interchange protein